MRRPVLSLLLCAALAGGAIAAGPVQPALADTDSVTVAGSLQNELGCSGDWLPDCAATHLTRVAGTSTWLATFQVPAGSYEFKVAVNDSWAVNYGAGGVANGPNLPLVLGGSSRLEFSFDADSHRIGVRPLDLSGATTPADRRLAQDSLRRPLTGEQYYFLMADRFANGDPANDTGGLTGDRLTTGFDPTDKGFYHGGDLKGLIGKLDYIKGLGTTAIWLTPSFKNRAVQGTTGNESAGYHGYWITDFTQIDPHLGTNADMKRLISKAHAKGLKVFFDIITNHTADVIDYSEKKYEYISTAQAPYTDASGKVFNPADVAGSADFPALDVESSFPYHPIFNTAADATAKVPAWLNDRTLYHNRGDSTFAGESSEYGDFVGLDDLFTENPVVVDGMIDIYNAWVDLGIDGFRIDTVKHVNTEFWQKFAPAIQAEAQRIGNRDFFTFGEVYDARPDYLSTFTTKAKLPATLDFGFQAQAQAFALGKETTSLRDLYVADDYYTDADSNAYQLPTFLGNHDMGRLSYLLRNGGITEDADLLKRVQLANTLMYLTRGQPIVYYGDEQGFIGKGGDKDARQDMFATQTEQYADEPVLGGTAGARDRFDPTAPLYRFIKKLAALRKANPGLTDGAQIHRYASSDAGIYAFSRVDRRGIEYVVALNNATTAKTATVATFNAREFFSPVYGTKSPVRTDKAARLKVTVPPLSAVVYKARTRVDSSLRPTAVTVTAPAPGGVVGGRAEISAELNTSSFSQVSFWYRPVGTSKWQALGTDDSAPYRVFHDVSDHPAGTLIEYRAVARDAAGRVSGSASYGIVGIPEAAGGDDSSVGPVTQPEAVSVPGNHNSEMGCTADWQPDCAQATLTLDPGDQVWKGSFTTIPAGDFAYKAAINKTWDENYGAGGIFNGANIAYTSPGAKVSFYYDHRTHYVTSSAQGDLITAPGSWNSELGCSADGDAKCMRPWLQDPDGDGTFTWATSELPPGDYTFKIAHNLNIDETTWLPIGDAKPVTVSSAGLVVRVNYNAATGEVTTRVAPPVTEPSLSKTKGVWLSPELVAWPTAALPVDASRLEFRLHWGDAGALVVDAEDITGGESAILRYDAGGLPPAVVAANPELGEYLALRVDRRSARGLPGMAAGDVAVGVYFGGRLVDAGMVDASAVK